MTSRTSLVALALAASLSASLGACGGGGSEEAAAPEPSGIVESSAPCDEVWVAGETLPEDYEGCVLEGSTVVALPSQPCPSGAQLAVFEDRLYAVPGEAIQESTSGDLFSDPAYLEYTESC